jgi:flagellar hook-length control protein FliK
MAGTAGGIATGAPAGGRGAGPRGAGAAADAPDSFAALLQGRPAATGAAQASAQTESAAAATAESAEVEAQAAPGAITDTASDTDMSERAAEDAVESGTSRRQGRPSHAAAADRTLAQPAARQGREPVSPNADADVRTPSDAAADADTVTTTAQATAPSPLTTNPLAVSAEAMRSLEWILGALPGGGAAAPPPDGAPEILDALQGDAASLQLRAPLQAALRQAALAAGGGADGSAATDVSIDQPSMPADGDAGSAPAAIAGSAAAPTDFARSIEQLAAALRPDGVAAAANDAGVLGNPQTMTGAPPSSVSHTATPTPTPLPVPAAPPNPLLLDHPDALADLGERILWQLDAEVSEACIELHPAELGQLTVRIETRGDQAQVQFVAQEAATRTLLSQALPQLRELLGSSGLQLTRSQVDGGRRGTDADTRSAAAGGQPQGARKRITRVALVDAYV